MLVAQDLLQAVEQCMTQLCEREITESEKIRITTHYSSMFLVGLLFLGAQEARMCKCMGDCRSSNIHRWERSFLLSRRWS